MLWGSDPSLADELLSRWPYWCAPCSEWCGLAQLCLSVLYGGFIFYLLVYLKCLLLSDVSTEVGPGVLWAGAVQATSAVTLSLRCAIAVPITCCAVYHSAVHRCAIHRSAIHGCAIHRTPQASPAHSSPCPFLALRGHKQIMETFSF